MLVIAASIDLSPCLFARLMLQHILRINPAMLAIVRGLPSSRDAPDDSDADGALAAEPAAHHAHAPQPQGPQQRGNKQLLPTPADVKRLWKDPWLIPDERLQREVVACIDADDAYSPLAERVRQCVACIASVSVCVSGSL